MSIVINDVSPRVHYDATAGQTVFAVPFPWIANSHLKVYVNEVLATFQAPATTGMTYSTSGENTTAGGSITFGAPGRVAGDDVIIFRDMPIERTTDMPTSGVFSVEALNRNFDDLTAMVQQTEVNVQERTLGMAVNDFVHPLNRIPNKAGRANKILGFDFTGQPIMLAPADIVGTPPGGIHTGDGNRHWTGDGQPPTPWQDGDLWWESDSGNTFIFYDDGTSGQWVQITSSGGGSSSVPACGTRDIIKALMSKNVAYLTEAGREGMFVWRTGNYMTRVDADTQEGIYLKAEGVSSTVGAWVRCVPGTVGGLDSYGGGHWHADWFGIPTAASGQSHSHWTALINLGNIVKPSSITCGSKIYELGAAIPEFNWQVEIIGQRGWQGTIFYKAYVETSPVRGVLAFNDFGFTLVRITVRTKAGSGAIGGSGVSAILTLSDPAAGRTYLYDVYISGAMPNPEPNGFNYSLYINGSANVNVGGPGYRGTFIYGGEYFPAQLGVMQLISVHHLFATNIFAASSSVSDNALYISGTAAAYSDDIQMYGLFAGRIYLNYVGRSVFSSPMISNITIEATCADIMWLGPKIAGVITNSAATGEFTMAYNGMVVASAGNAAAGWRMWGSGELEQWGTATTPAGGTVTVTWPTVFASIYHCSVNATVDSGVTSMRVCQAATITTTNFLAKCWTIANTPSIAPAATALMYLARGY